jgi:mRNA interferase RelE/StbE
MYKVILEKPVLKFLEKHKWEIILDQFEKALVFLVNDPYENDLDIRLISWLPNSYWLRIWKYRFLYEIIENTISISFFKTGSRWEIYKNL